VPDWTRLASASDCNGNGCVHAATAEGEKIVLVRWRGEFFALEDRCSHQDFPLSEGEMDEGEIECVFHGARFDVRTGRAVSLPAIRPVKTYPVEVRGDDIYVDLG
jgi:3-phenylpropionate/trans-cinnamate dioxygenase ferredoxin component